MDSILTSIKKLLGISEECEDFDQDVIIHINSVFSILKQLGVGPSTGFRISNKSAVWNDFLADDTTMEDVKTYVYMKVKIMFDPPSSSIVMEASNRIISELEWRINVEAETPKETQT